MDGGDSPVASPTGLASTGVDMQPVYRAGFAPEPRTVDAPSTSRAEDPQVELAAAIEVTQAQISHVESGRRAATPELLDRVAAATSFPRSFFDAVPADLPPLTLRFRRRASARSIEVHRVEQLVAETYRVIWQLLHSGGTYVPPTLPVALDPEMSADDIERSATATREALGLDGSSPVRNVTRVLERGDSS